MIFTQIIGISFGTTFLLFLFFLLFIIYTSLSLRASARARFPITSDFAINSISFASSGVDICPTIIIFSYTSITVLSIMFKRSCCTTVTHVLYSYYQKRIVELFEQKNMISIINEITVYPAYE